MAPMMKALSMRVSRTSEGLPTSPQNIGKASSEPGNLETAFSDDSSVFSGLPSIQSPRDNADVLQQDSSDHSGLNSILSGKKSTTGVHFDDGRLTDTQRSRHTCVGKYKMKTVFTEESESEEERTAFISVMRSGSAIGSEKSYLKAGTDRTSTYEMGQTPLYPGTYTDVDEYQDLGDNDASTMSYGSVHGVVRPRGRMNFVSEVQFLQQEEKSMHSSIHQREVESQEPALAAKSYGSIHGSQFGDNDESTMSYGSGDGSRRLDGRKSIVSETQYFRHEEKVPDTSFDQQEVESRDPVLETRSGESRNSNGNETRITEMLQEYEKQMDANLVLIKSEDNGPSYLSELQDVIPRRVKSEDEKQVLTQHQSRQLRRVLNQARTEVEVLKDNNEQFMSEIEQMEEENMSEKKLVEERYKQKISELKAMYQDEIESVIKEKDAAIVEASRQTSKCLDSGRKQISTLKIQIEKLKTQAAGLNQQCVDEAVQTFQKKKDEEMAARLGALRKSYEGQLERNKLEFEKQSQLQMNEAVSSVTQRLLADRDREVKEKENFLRQQFEVEKKSAVKAATYAYQQEVSNLRMEREAVTKALESVKENVHSRYPEQIAEMKAKSSHSSGALQLVKDQENGPKSNVEKLFKEVIEAFAFILDASENKVASATYLANVEELKKERSEVYAKARKELMLRHRAEMEQSKKQQEDSKDKIFRLEESLKNLGREKRFLEDKYRRAVESHRLEVEKVREEKEKDVLLNVEKGRKDLAVAREKSKAELAQSTTAGRQHFLKPKTAEGKEVDTKSQAPEHPEQEKSGSKEMRTSEQSRTAVTSQLESPNDRQEPIRGNYSHLPEGIRRLRRRHLDRKEEIESSKLRVDSSNEVTKPKLANDPPSQADFNKGNSSARSDPEEPFGAVTGVTEDEKKANGLEKCKEPMDVKPAKSESSSHSYRSKRSVLVRVRKQTQETPDTTSTTTTVDEKPRPEPTGAKDTVSKESMKQKSFAILRNFKAARDNANQRDPVTSTQGKEPEGTTEHSRRARKFRSLFETLKTEDSSRARDSLAEESLSSLSSLRADTGATEPQAPSLRRADTDATEPCASGLQVDVSVTEPHASSLRHDNGAEPQSPQVVKSPKSSDHSFRRRRRTVLAEARNASSHSRTTKISTEDNSSRGERSVSGGMKHEKKTASQDETSRVASKNRNPLGMFTNSKSDDENKNDTSAETENLTEPQVPTAEPNSSNDLSEDGIPAPPKQSATKQQGEASNTLKFKKTVPPADGSRDTSCATKPIGNAKSDKHDDPSPTDDKDNTALGEITNPIRNLKKPSRLVGLLSNMGRKSPPPPHVINGKKPPLSDWVGESKDPTKTPKSETCQNFALGGKEEEVPETIALRQSAKKQFVTPAAGGHTMCLRPLPVENAKHSNIENISGLSSTDSNGFPVTSGLTSATVESTDDDCLKYDSQSQLRNYPPLGDDESEEDSGSDSDDTDRYTSLEPPVQFAQDYSRTEHTGKCVPIVISRSVDESPVLYMDSNESKPIVVQGRPIYRQPELSAFSPRHDASETSSEATTAITAHTFRSSLQTEPKKKLPKSPRELLRSNLPPPPPSEAPPRRTSNFLSFKRRASSRRAEI